MAIEEYKRKEYVAGMIKYLQIFLRKGVYELLKSRVEIDLVFDTTKNLLYRDNTYLRRMPS